jgi:hypothetical protein
MLSCAFGIPSSTLRRPPVAEHVGNKPVTMSISDILEYFRIFYFSCLFTGAYYTSLGQIYSESVQVMTGGQIVLFRLAL